MTIKILSKDNDLVGTDKYRDDTKSVPLAYRHTIDMSVNPNASGTNNMVTVKSTLPVPAIVDGRATSNDAFTVSTKFSSLQHITNDVERAAVLTKHIEFLTKAKDAMLDGQLPDEPIVMTA